MHTYIHTYIHTNTQTYNYIQVTRFTEQQGWYNELRDREKDRESREGREREKEREREREREKEREREREREREKETKRERERERSRVHQGTEQQGRYHAYGCCNLDLDASLPCQAPVLNCKPGDTYMYIEINKNVEIQQLESRCIVAVSGSCIKLQTWREIYTYTYMSIQQLNV